MKTMKTATLILLVAVQLNAAEVAKETYTHKVYQGQPHKVSVFKVKKDVDHVATLNTIPGFDEEKFNTKKSKFIASRRHGAQTWVVTAKGSTSKLFSVKSPPIPKGDTSWVIVKGQFLPEGADGGGGAKKKVELKGVEWRSEVVQPSVHVIVINRYPDDKNALRINELSGVKVSYNDGFEASGLALAASLEDAAPNSVRVIRYACGLDRAGTWKLMPTIDKLKEHLATDVKGALIGGFHSIGHGELVQVNYASQDEGNPNVSLGKRPPRDYDLKNDFAANWLKPFVKNDAVINLHHCYSATVNPKADEDYKSATEMVYKGLMPDKSKVVVSGYTDGVKIRFAVHPTTKQLIGYLPSSDGFGDNLEFQGAISE